MVYTSTLSLFKQIRDEIKPIYGPEADMLAMFIVEDVSGFSSTDILTDHRFLTGPNFRATILKYILRLKRQEPIQYILGKAYFFDNYFEVNENTLIPRPETEELVKLVERHLDENKKASTVLDIGTGSGCIAISIDLSCPEIRVSAMDISMSAIKVAERNNAKLKAGVDFFQEDIFTFITEKKYDVIVSNPPYVRESEKKAMHKNVLEFEPARALFVTDEQPLIYYEQIIEFAKAGLSEKGAIYLEVNQYLAGDVAKLLVNSKYETVIITKDVNGNDRFVQGLKGE